jgi:excisionase family DNA binding protein
MQFVVEFEWREVGALRLESGRWRLPEVPDVPRVYRFDLSDRVYIREAARLLVESPEGPTLEELPEVLTVEEAAAVLRISRGAAYALARRYLATDKREGLPVVRLGRSLRVPRARLVALLEPDVPRAAAPPTGNVRAGEPGGRGQRGPRHRRGAGAVPGSGHHSLHLPSTGVLPVGAEGGARHDGIRHRQQPRHPLRPEG